MQRIIIEFRKRRTLHLKVFISVSALQQHYSSLWALHEYFPEQDVLTNCLSHAGLDFAVGTDLKKIMKRERLDLIPCH